MISAMNRDNGSSGTSFHQYAPGHFRMERRDKGQDIVLVASEPLTFERADWVTVPSNCSLPSSLKLTVAILTINGQTVLLHPIIGLLFKVDWLMVDEHHVPDPLHSRRSGFAESKGQSIFVSAC